MVTSHTAQAERTARCPRVLTALLTASVAWLLLAAPAPAGGSDTEPDVARTKALLEKRTAELGPDHPDTLAAMMALADAYCDDGDSDKAVPLYEKVLQKRRAKLGPDHPDTLKAMVGLGISYRMEWQDDKAVAMLEPALAKTKAKLGSDHLDTLAAMQALADAYRDAERSVSAMLLHGQVIERRRKSSVRMILPRCVPCV